MDDDNCLENDCDGICGGDAVDDACGTCEGSITDATQCDCPVSGEIRDCAGDCGGDAVNDDCDECGGDNSSCVNYSTEIQPIFTANCTGCHGSSSGLNLGSYSTLMSGGNSGAVVISGNGSGSRLIQKLQGTASGNQMPKNQSPLNDATINLIETWIDEGALDN